MSGFSGSTSRSILKGDLSCTVQTDTGTLLHFQDTDSTLMVLDTIRILLSVRQIQKKKKSGHTIVLGTKARIQINRNIEHFVTFILCKTTSLWVLPLLPTPSATNKVYTTPVPTLVANASENETRMADHQRLGHPNFKRMRSLDIEEITKIPPAKRMKSISCPVCIAAKMSKPNRPTFLSSDYQPLEP